MKVEKMIIELERISDDYWQASNKHTLDVAGGRTPLESLAALCELWRKYEDTYNKIDEEDKD